MAISDDAPPRWIPSVVCATLVCAAGATLGKVMVANGEGFFGWLFTGLSIGVCGGADAHISHAGWNAIR